MVTFIFALIIKLSVYVCQPMNISKYKQKHLVRGVDGATEGHTHFLKCDAHNVVETHALIKRYQSMAQ